MSNQLLVSITVESKTSAEWFVLNPILPLNKAAYSTDNKELRIGNGIDPWRNLPIDLTHTSVPPHANIHSTGARDEIIPVDINAADRVHTHIPSECASTPIEHVGTTGDSHGPATTLVNGFMTTVQVTKLNSIANNANNYSHPNHSGDIVSSGDGNTVISNDVVNNTKLTNMAASTIKGRITSDGDPQDLTPTQVRTMINVENGANNYTHPTTHPATIIVEDTTHRFVTDLEKQTWSDKQTALGFTPENLANKNTANGYAGLDTNGKLNESQIPSLAITDVFEANSQASMLALSTAKRGDVCIRTDINKTYILATDGYSTLSNWKELRTPTDLVLSVAGKTGAVTLTAIDVGLHKLTTTQTINSGSSFSINLPVEFLTSELEFLDVSVKFKDVDNKYYNAVGVSYYSIDKTTRTFQLFNDYTTSLEFVICIRN